jgi:hypothetical protein
MDARTSTIMIRMPMSAHSRIRPMFRLRISDAASCKRTTGKTELTGMSKVRAHADAMNVNLSTLFSKGH